MSIPSRASFEKRRRERAKKQKRQDKLNRRLERKAQKAAGLIEYDEYGNEIVPTDEESAQENEAPQDDASKPGDERPNGSETE